MPECDFHPGVETGVRCPDCERYICPKDMVETPVGYKCRECGLVGRPKLGGVKPRQYLLGAAAGLGSGILLGAVLAFVPFFSFFAALLMGVAVGEATRRGAGGHRTREFAVIAGVGAALGVGVSFALGRFNPIALVLAPLAAAFYLMSNRWS